MSYPPGVETLAEELYTRDMGDHQGEYMPWSEQIERVKEHYRRLAYKFTDTAWYRARIAQARLRDAF